MHLTGLGLFPLTRDLARHEALVDPLLFAQRLLVLAARNHGQKPGFSLAVLGRVLVFRGEPSADHDPRGYARNQAQKARWERDERVGVTLRPLRYKYERAAHGGYATDHDGAKIVIGLLQEKGVDVMCALATVREAQDPSVDLVIHASSDADLAPALDEVRRLGSAKIEAFWPDQAVTVGPDQTDRARAGFERRTTSSQVRSGAHGMALTPLRDRSTSWRQCDPRSVGRVIRR